MALHKDLTGNDLHEPKGVATAPAGTVYTSDGLGSGTWGKIGIPNVNFESIPPLVFWGERYSVPNINETKTHYWVMGRAGRLLELRSVVSGTVSNDTTLTFRKNSTSAFSTIPINAATPSGTVFSGQPTPSVPFDVGDIFTIESNGTGSGIATFNLHFLFAFNY